MIFLRLTQHADDGFMALRTRAVAVHVVHVANITELQIRAMCDFIAHHRVLEDDDHHRDEEEDDRAEGGEWNRWMAQHATKCRFLNLKFKNLKSEKCE